MPRWQVAHLPPPPFFFLPFALGPSLSGLVPYTTSGASATAVPEEVAAPSVTPAGQRGAVRSCSAATP